MRPQLFEQNIIKEVQKYGCLYHKDLVSNRSNEKRIERASAWAAVANNVGSTAEECRERWHRLREWYMKVVTKASSDPEYKTDWKYIEAMSFMKEHLKLKSIFLESIPQVVSNDLYSREMFEENVIEEVKKYELIYNLTHPDYKSRSKKENVWVAIASSVGNTVHQCRDRWKSLRDVYQRILVRLHDDPEYISHWKYMDTMSFMKYHLDLKPKDCAEKMPEDEFYEEKLIEEVQKYECVYNNAHPDYRKRSIKVEVWSSIASVVGKTVQQCKARWWSLRERYVKEYLKMSSDNACEEYTSHWKYIDAMFFMKDYVALKPDILETADEISKRDMFCRACMCQVLNDSDEQSSKSYHIFQTLDLADKLMNCTNLQITSWDEYPHSVCEKCYGQILEFYQFQTMCRNSLEKFKEIQQNQMQVKCEFDLEEASNKSVANHSTLSDNLLENQTAIKCENYLEIIQDGDPLDEDVISDALFEQKHGLLVENNSYGVEAEINCEEYKDETVDVKLVKPEKNQLEEDDDTLEDSSDNEESISEDIDTSGLKRKPRGKVIFKCDICPKTFLVQHCFDAHQRRHQGLSGYACTYANCDRAYNRVTDLTRHLNEHKGISNAFKCTIANCDKVFAQYSGLNYHKRKYHKCGKELKKKKKKDFNEIPKSFICETCGKVFNSNLLLKNHRLTHVDESQWPFVCDVEGCSRRFRMMYRLKVHRERHSGIKNHVCPHCGMRKATRNELNIHVNFHTFERKYPCRICSKVFKSVGMVSTHIHKVHEGQKPRSFQCRFCDRTLSTLRNRTVHERSHTGDGLITCEECDKTFTSPESLKMHMNMHFKGEKRHTCKECGKKFTFPGALTCHMRLHIETKPYSCEECGQGFRWPGSYYRHKKKHIMDKRKDNVQQETKADEDNIVISVQESDILEVAT